MSDISLGVDLRFFAFGWGRECHGPEYPGAYALGQRLDDSTFAGCIAALENHDDTSPCLFNPLLHVRQLDVQRSQFPFVFGAFHFRIFKIPLI
jgi:hypothetical protein